MYHECGMWVRINGSSVTVCTINSMLVRIYVKYIAYFPSPVGDDVSRLRWVGLRVGKKLYIKYPFIYGINKGNNCLFHTLICDY